ncbi:transcription factor Ouib-like [Teleopsis dalmanni]|uniref:transcription factor Ouib-like n=1 Tax=Teleopsis dalmanni TaxID=139649 RepID=UPI0018CFB217|nr:transcription factor Ouib-like [Teleopsis dalmanni]
MEFGTKCRICLIEVKSEEKLKLYTNISLDMNLSNRVEYCCDIKLRDAPDLPKQICQSCYDIVKHWFDFRQLCINTQIYLESSCNNDLFEPEINNTIKYNKAKLHAFLKPAQRDLPLTKIRNIERTENKETTRHMNEEPESSAETNDAELALNDCSPIKEKNIPQITEEKLEKKVTKNRKSSQYLSSSNGTFMCSICGNVYKKKSAFKYHMSLHSDVRPHDCEICGKNFRQVSELNNHMRRHTGEKPYKCSVCDRHFIDRSEKHRHEMVHTDLRPYVCNICGKSFQYAAILKNHSKLHSGEKEYNCFVCQKSFTLQHQLKAHLQTMVHKQKESKFSDEGYDVIFD